MLHMSVYRIEYLPLIDVLLMHEVSQLFVVMLQHLHRRVMDVLRLHRVLAGVHVVSVVMHLSARDRRSVRALMSSGSQSLVHALGVCVHPVDVTLHYLLHDSVPVRGL
jgi:urease gamma subunit